MSIPGFEKIDKKAHTFDFPALALGHPKTSKHTVFLLDLETQVYGLDEIKGSTLPIGVIAANMEACAYGILGEMRRLEKQSGRRKVRDVLVVTLDHRNHGSRTKYRDRNLSFDVNPLHLIDMGVKICGATQDQRLIIDFLPSYLFPNDTRVVDQWMAIGVSMGGHSVWRLLREEPRITIGVPMISMPSEALDINFVERAQQYGVIPIYPKGTQEYLKTPPVKGCYAGKKILSISGAKDFTMPPERAQRFIEERIRPDAQSAPGGCAEIFIDHESGHRAAPPMIERAAEWCWRWGLSEDLPPAAKL